MKKLFHTVHDKWHVKTFCYALLILAVHRRLLWWMQICVSYWNYIFSWNWAFSFESSLWHFWRSPRPTSHWFSLLQGDCLVKKPPDPTFLSLPEKELSGWVFVQMSHIYNNFTGWDVTDKKKNTPLDPDSGSFAQCEECSVSQDISGRQACFLGVTCWKWHQIHNPLFVSSVYSSVSTLTHLVNTSRNLWAGTWGRRLQFLQWPPEAGPVDSQHYRVWPFWVWTAA